MDSAELLQKGNLMVIHVVDGFPETGWDMPGACGDWSVKDIIARLSSYEHTCEHCEQIAVFRQNITPEIGGDATAS
jgi:hypothetical protein